MRNQDCRYDQTVNKMYAQVAKIVGKIGGKMISSLGVSKILTKNVIKICNGEAQTPVGSN
jgi:hypothetical protein